MAALNEIGDISGMRPLTSPSYTETPRGGKFKEVNLIPHHFQVDYDRTVLAPWLGYKAEWGSMNRLKVKNEPPVKTYRDLKFLHIPTEQHDENCLREGFGLIDIEQHEYQKNFIILIAIVILVYLLLNKANLKF